MLKIVTTKTRRRDDFIVCTLPLVTWFGWWQMELVFWLGTLGILVGSRLVPPTGFQHPGALPGASLSQEGSESGRAGLPPMCAHRHIGGKMAMDIHHPPWHSLCTCRPPGLWRQGRGKTSLPSEPVPPAIIWGKCTLPAPARYKNLYNLLNSTLDIRELSEWQVQKGPNGLPRTGGEKTSLRRNKGLLAVNLGE